MTDTYIKELGRVHESIVAIHNDLFDPGLWRTIRRMIPVPFLFESVDYHARGRELDSLRDEIAKLENDFIHSAARSPELRSALISHTTVLETYAKRLQWICEALAAKADGSRTLAYDEYQGMLSNFENAKNACVESGTRLNNALFAERSHTGA